ncbi:hypothetical protein ACFWP3_08085 [Streptomyces sp. NPDC058525]|uniref:hypothetical protein n=1 Tax=unclassified Streptomyces TaxID=2593676 RepID=UPI0036561611
MATASPDNHHALPGPPAGPSPELQDRAADGLARFMARWEPPDDVQHDQADDAAEDR